jgi:DNA-binding transcriptional LysR family regulator
VDKRELVEIDIQPPVTVSQNGGMGVYMLYQKHKYHVPKIKAAVDFLQSKIGS